MGRKRVARTLAVLLACAGCAGAQIHLNEKEYFEGPGIKFLLFHNNYLVGYQGGLQLVENGERILDSGNLLLVPKPGRRVPRLLILRRDVDRAAGTATVVGRIDGWDNGYRFVCRTDGEKIYIKLILDKPLDWSGLESGGFAISIYPPSFYGKSFESEIADGVFPRQFDGRTLLARSNGTLRLAGEDPLHAVTFSRSGGPLTLSDPRNRSVRTWFLLMAPFTPGSSETSLEVGIAPSLRPEWRRPPVIGISQVGYHPRQPKRAVMELDPRQQVAGMVRLYRLTLHGAPALIKQEPLVDWGIFQSFRYGIFDFSEIRTTGLYVIEYGGQRAGPFRIADDVFERAWKPTLQTFIPTQMCHVKVRQGSRIWHGACHLDDAQQAPAGKEHIDGYAQGERETKYADNEHVPGLNWGGWHDAGDHDIPAGSLNRTIEGLALAWEEFGARMDTTTIDRKKREVVLQVPDGDDDFLQQVAYGVEWLLATYHASGHVLPGVIERTGFQYGTKGDMVNTTDNRVYDSSLAAYEYRGNRSGTLDDRWVFTNRNTGLQYQTAQTLAISSRVLRKTSPELAAECLRVAQALWKYEHGREPVWGRGAYTPRDTGFRGFEIAATAELFLTTRDPLYRKHLLSLVPVFENVSPDRFVAGPGMTLARAFAVVNDPRLYGAVEKQLRAWKELSDQRTAASPYGVVYRPEVINPGHKIEPRTQIHSGFVWGDAWRFQLSAMRHYYFHRAFPRLFGPEVVFDTVNYVLGCHPANNKSLVSGVGANSITTAFGFNRADWSYQPGGIISGPSLIKPDLLELKSPFPFLWYQTEIVINAAGSWIFDVLAAKKLAGELR